MKNLKIQKKLIVTFGIILILFCITVVMATLGLTSNGKRFDDFYKAGFEVTSQSMAMRTSIQSAAKNIGYATMTDDKGETQKYIDACQADLDTMEDGLDMLRDNFKGDMKLLDDFNATMTAATEAKATVFDYALKLENESAAKVFFSEYAPLLIKAMGYLEQINTFSGESAIASYQQSRQAETTITVLLVALSIVAFVITMILAVYITRSLRIPIQEIENAATKMAQGDLDIEIVYESKDEMGVLANHMRTLTSYLKEIISDEAYLLGEMADGNFNVNTRIEEKYIGAFAQLLRSMQKINKSLSDTLSQINEASGQVASGSDQVASSAQALSQGATQQASSVEELAATINDISHQVNASAQNAAQASEKASMVGEEAMQSNQRMRDMLNAMSDISTSSGEIGKIIKTIEDIAFQTNILALNAAVEAARAGAAGKGFAVVADEVRNLASKSAEASKNTADLIESSLEAVDHGAIIADATALSLQSVVDGVKDMTQTIDKISEASKDQAQSITQVTTGIDQISSVVQTNSATAQQSAAASEELSGQAQMLKSLVSKFSLAKP